MAAVTFPLFVKISSSLNWRKSIQTINPILPWSWDISPSCLSFGIVQIHCHDLIQIYHFFFVHIIVSTALGVNVRDFLIKTALAGANITNTLQLFLKIVLTKGFSGSRSRASSIT